MPTPLPAAPDLKAPRWHRRPEERPQQILEAAFRVFGTHGLHQATLDDVAREAGITKGTIYLYFPSKAALFSAMLKSRVNDLLPPLEAAGNETGPQVGPDELVTFGRRLYRFMRSPAYLNMFRTIIGESAQFPEVAEGVFREGILAANKRMGALLAHGIARGRFRAVDPVVASRAFAGMFLVFAVTQRLLGGERIYPIREAAVVKTVTDIFLHGLLTSVEPRAASRESVPPDHRTLEPSTPRPVVSPSRRPAVPSNSEPRVAVRRPQAAARSRRQA